MKYPSAKKYLTNSMGIRLGRDKLINQKRSEHNRQTICQYNQRLLTCTNKKPSAPGLHLKIMGVIPAC
jgi:hypothetical protein